MPIYGPGRGEWSAQRLVQGRINMAMLASTQLKGTIPTTLNRLKRSGLPMWFMVYRPKPHPANPAIIIRRAFWTTTVEAAETLQRQQIFELFRTTSRTPARLRSLLENFRDRPARTFVPSPPTPSPSISTSSTKSAKSRRSAKRKSRD
mgnify:FL=1